jgi:hypothetical protein
MARAGRMIQIFPHTIQDDPRKSSCKGVTPGAADALSYLFFSVFLFTTNFNIF